MKGYKLVPVEPTAAMIEALAADIYPDDNQSGKRLQRLRGTGVVFPKYEIESAVGKYERMLAAAPTPPQPIFDEAKERELFEVYCVKIGLPVDTLPSGEYLFPATLSMSQGWHARAKAGEVGHE